MTFEEWYMDWDDPPTDSNKRCMQIAWDAGQNSLLKDAPRFTFGIDTHGCIVGMNLDKIELTAGKSVVYALVEL
jgi:hypothetical protein